MPFSYYSDAHERFDVMAQYIKQASIKMSCVYS